MGVAPEVSAGEGPTHFASEVYSWGMLFDAILSQSLGPYSPATKPTECTPIDSADDRSLAAFGMRWFMVMRNLYRRQFSEEAIAALSATLRRDIRERATLDTVSR